MKSIGFAMIASVAVSAPVFAQNDQPFRGTPLFSETFESFDLGLLPPQGGWTSQFDLNANITDINPISGARSVRHTSDGTSIPGFEIVSPAFAQTFDPVTSTIRLSGTGSTYQLVPQDTTFGQFNARVSFDTDGAVRVSQITVDDFGTPSIDFIDTGFDWLIETDYQVSIQSFMDGSLTVGINGSNVFTGEDANFSIFGITAGISQFRVFAGNEGSGAVDGSGDTLTFDDFFVGVPAPGSIALLAMSGVASLRRKR